MASAVAGIELPEGDPGAVQDAAAAMRRSAGGFEGAGGTAAAAAAAVPGWNGLASFTFRTHCGTYRDAAAAAEAVCSQAAGALARYGHELEDGRERVRDLQRQGEQCVERMRAAERAAADATDREAAARHLAYQASFLAGADAGSLRTAAENQAADAAADRQRALREQEREREELERLRREAERERERVKEAGRRAAAEVSSMAVEMPEVAYPGAPVTAAPVAGARPDTGGGAGQFAKDAAGELSGYSDAKRGIEDLGDGDILGGAFHLAMAWPGAKAVKGVKELGEEAVERVTKETAEEGGERVARETIPAFKGTPGEHLPVYSGGKTEGVIEVGGERLRVQSGYGRPSADLAPKTPGFNGFVKAHVEAHVAALMRQRNLDRVELYINQNPCLNPVGCDRMLPRMLPEGSELVVHGPGGEVFVYKGLPD